MHPRPQDFITIIITLFIVTAIRSVKLFSDQEEKDLSSTYPTHVTISNSCSGNCYYTLSDLTALGAGATLLSPNQEELSSEPNDDTSTEQPATSSTATNDDQSPPQALKNLLASLHPTSITLENNCTGNCYFTLGDTSVLESGATLHSASTGQNDHQQKNSEVNTPVSPDKMAPLDPEEESDHKKIVLVGLFELTHRELSDTWPVILTLYKAVNNPAFAALIIKLDGDSNDLGSAYALYQELKLGCQKKPIIAYIPSHCTGGCFYVAAGTQERVASPTAILGQIGAQTIIIRHDHERIKDDHFEADSTYTISQIGTYKTMFHPKAPALTDDQKALIKELLQDEYDQFCHDISSSLNLPLTEKKQWADGRPLLVRQAGYSLATPGSYSTVITRITKLLQEQGISCTSEDLHVISLLRASSKQEPSINSPQI